MASKMFRLGCAALLMAGAGCGTVANFASERHGPSIYGGLAFDVDLMGTSGCRSQVAIVFGVLDFPFSLVMDTATLPATVLCELFGWRR